MLRKIKDQSGRADRAAFGIVASRYNARYVEGMLRAARKTLQAGGAGGIRVVRVPGAYEIPVVAARLARTHQPPLAAILCLGVILRGATTHAQHIEEAVTFALTRIQLEYEIPIIHEVLLLENLEQARVRCLSPDHNRGTEAAHTALAMARLMEGLASPQMDRPART